MKTALFYINTNNGCTEFECGVRVSSVANRVCIFDSNLQHRGVTHTEGDPQRIVVNFNYFTSLYGSKNQEDECLKHFTKANA